MSTATSLPAYPLTSSSQLTWGHTHLVRCPACQGPALVGYADGTPVAYTCHRCGPIKPAPLPPSPPLTSLPTY